MMFYIYQDLIKNFRIMNITIIYYQNITNIIIFAKHINFIDDNFVLLNKFNNFYIIKNGRKNIFNNIYKQITEK